MPALVDLARQLARDRQHDMLPWCHRPDRFRILAAVAGIDGDDQRPHARLHPQRRLCGGRRRGDGRRRSGGGRCGRHLPRQRLVARWLRLLRRCRIRLGCVGRSLQVGDDFRRRVGGCLGRIDCVRGRRLRLGGGRDPRDGIGVAIAGPLDDQPRAVGAVFRQPARPRGWRVEHSRAVPGTAAAAHGADDAPGGHAPRPIRLPGRSTTRRSGLDRVRTLCSACASRRISTRVPVAPEVRRKSLISAACARFQISAAISARPSSTCWKLIPRVRMGRSQAPTPHFCNGFSL